MGSIRDITAKDIIDEDPVTANIGQTLSKVRTKMEDNNLRTIPIVDGAKFVGMLSYQDMMEKVRSDPSITKVKPLVHQPPEVQENKNLVELANLRINSGRKKFALVGEHDRLVGVIGEQEMADAAKETDELQPVDVEDLMTPNVITIDEDKSHETARELMMDNNISRLPVLNNDDLSGVITSNDLLRAMIPREQMQKGDYKAHKDSLSDIPVREVMKKTESFDATIIDDHDATVTSAIDAMQQNNKREVVVINDNTPSGILTLRDVVDFVARHEAVEGIQVQLSGVDVDEEKAAITDKVETQLRGGLGRLLDRPEELRIHVKQYEKDGKRHKYSLRFKLVSAQGVTTVNTHGWDLLNAVDEGLDELETVIKKQKEKKRDQTRDQERDEKYS